MSTGVLSPLQAQALGEIVQGRTVHDLGAGDLILAHTLIGIGAGHVIAIDCQQPPGYRFLVEFRQQRFTEVSPHEGIDVAFISWPRTNPGFRNDGLVALVERAKIVAYLGMSTDGLRCGDPNLWDHLARRQVIKHVPHRRNTLIVYGKTCGRRRALAKRFLEERAAISPVVLRYEEAQETLP